MGLAVRGPGRDQLDQLLGATVGMFDVGPTSVSPLYARIIRLRLSQGGSVYLVDDPLNEGELCWSPSAETALQLLSFVGKLIA